MRSTPREIPSPELASQIDQIGPEAWREEHEQIAERLIAEGVPEPLARRTAFQGELVHAPDIIAVSHATGRAPLEVARGFFLLGERLELDWLENQLEALPAGTRWQRWARQSMEDDLFSLRRSLCERALELAGERPSTRRSTASSRPRGKPSPASNDSFDPRDRRRHRPLTAHRGAQAGPRLVG